MNERKSEMADTMRGAFLPGDKTAELREFDVPRPGHGQVLLKMMASGICGSDLSYIWGGYKTFEGMDGPAYKGVIAGHEPAGVVVELGEGVTRAKKGDRALLYHIAGCGQCLNCRAGYDISCHGPHAAYGWQRNGGHGEYILAEERSVIPLPSELTYEDGALISCGFGTAFEGLMRADVNGLDTLLVTGMGPVGMAVAMLGKAMGVRRIIGSDISEARLGFASDLGIISEGVLASEDAVDDTIKANRGNHVSVAIDCSGSRAGRATALRATAEWGRVALLGEGNDLLIDVSDTLLHRHLTIHASWVTSLVRMEQLTHHLVEWGIHPDSIVTDRMGLDDIDQAYKLAASGQSGKVCILGESD
jgi:threonine dehydrogenase-like Zn-dependent dehydrogenase